MGFWNVRGWNPNAETDNSIIRRSIIDFLELDIVGIAESHLKGNEILNQPGFIWFGHNRQALHVNARTGSGGVGLLVRDYLLNCFAIYMVKDDTEGILWIKFSAYSVHKTMVSLHISVFAIYHLWIHAVMPM